LKFVSSCFLVLSEPAGIVCGKKGSFYIEHYSFMDGLIVSLMCSKELIFLHRP